ncbi:MAG TPA: hypothetical protein VFI84_00495 [Candidatus Saccharimonadales bacterium]|nr:hypothetical protein [Candidatus Saccharimonadales bacterium]
MILVKVLKRKDASSVIVAILVAMIVSQLLTFVTARWSAWLSGQGSRYGYATPGSGWKGEYLFPVVSALVQLLVLEIIVRLYIWVTSAVKK